jgi:hypothetical protein
LIGVVGRLLEPAVVEHQHLGLLVFKKQLAIVRALQSAVDQLANTDFVETGAVEQRSIRIHGVLQWHRILDRKPARVRTDHGFTPKTWLAVLPITAKRDGPLSRAVQVRRSLSDVCQQLDARYQRQP